MPNGLVNIREISTSLQSVERDIAHWPQAAQSLVHSLVQKYGQPNEATGHLVIWYNKTPWKRMVVHHQGARHNFPQPHVDLLEQVIDCPIPVERMPELAAFDGSLTAERTEGELAVRCASEEMNILILNLAHEILMGRLTGQEARRRCRDTIRGRLLNWPLRETQALLFETNIKNAERRTADPDQAT